MGPGSTGVRELPNVMKQLGVCGDAGKGDQACVHQQAAPHAMQTDRSHPPMTAC